MSFQVLLLVVAVRDEDLFPVWNHSIAVLKPVFKPGVVVQVNTYVTSPVHVYKV